MSHAVAKKQKQKTHSLIQDAEGGWAPPKWMLFIGTVPTYY